MTTLTIHHRPAPFIAAAAALAALAAGTTALALSDHSSQPVAPGGQTSLTQDLPKGHHFDPTTSGGRVQVGP